MFTRWSYRVLASILALLVVCHGVPADQQTDYQQAMATLDKNPADPEANLVAGKYLCRVKGDWARGLPLLALSGEEEYAWLAAKELKEITEPAAQVDQGDGWWKLAERRDGTPQQQLRLHAAYWYRKAIPQLTGLLHEKVQQRLAQADQAQTHPAQAGQTQTHTPAGLVAELRNPFVSRSGPAKQLLLEAGGGTAESERAVAAALAWIARHQNPDGSWSIDYHSRCSGPGCTGPGSSNAPGAATAFGLLPFLAAGQTHETKGPYKAKIYAGITWTISHQRPTGDLSVTGGQTQMYSHGIATIMLCEAYGMSHDKRLEGPARAALRFIEVGQDQQTGGWWYTHRQPGGDTSIFGWQFMALKSGAMAGLVPSRVCFDLAQKWLDSVSKEPKGQFAYMPDKGPSETMTAVGLLCTQYLGASSSDPRLVEGTRFLMNNLPDTKTRNNYYWYYATQVMHNQPGPQWDDWNRQMRTVLIKTQCGDAGCANGSWDPAKPGPDPWAAQGGRLMMTSLAALTLELYYRYPPLYASARHEPETIDRMLPSSPSGN
jgi:hypothetical protein